MVEIRILKGHSWLVCVREPFSPGGCSMCANLVLCGPTSKCGTKMLLRDAPASPGVETAEEQVDSGRFCPKMTFHGKGASDTCLNRTDLEGVCDSRGLLAGWRECVLNKLQDLPPNQGREEVQLFGVKK